jgi:hypothetical protein
MCWWRSCASSWVWKLVFNQILQILSVTPFEKTPIFQALQASNSDSDLFDIGNQLILFDF